MPLYLTKTYETSQGETYEVTNAAYSCKTSRGDVAVHAPKLDKISMVFDVEPASQKKAVNQMEYLKEGPKQKPLIVTFAKGGTHLHGYQLKHSDLPNPVYLALAPKQSANAKRFARMEFNPHYIGKAGVAKLFDVLAAQLGDDFSLSKVRETATVTRFDAAVDFQNLHIDDLVMGKLDEHKTHVYFGKTGRQETFYGGIHASNKHGSIKLYNKVKQLLEKPKNSKMPELDKDIPLHIPLTRLEVTKKVSQPLHLLESVANPFEAVSLLFVKDAVGPETQRHWQWFVDCCRVRGIERTLATLDSDLKNKYQDTLYAQIEGVYQPEIIWKRWGQVVQDSGLM